MSFKYPRARRDETVRENYHGVEVCDSYRWLENPNSQETKTFIKAQNEITRNYVETKFRYSLKKNLLDLWEIPKFFPPQREGKKYFHYRNSGSQQQNVLYSQDTLNSKATLFLDPNKFSQDGSIILQEIKFSEDGTTLAYMLKSSTSNWQEIRFKDVASGRDYNEVLKKLGFTSMSWRRDKGGLFYCGCIERKMKAESNRIQKVYFHKFGTNQTEDIPLLAFKNPYFTPSAFVSFCGEYLIVNLTTLDKDKNCISCLRIDKTCSKIDSTGIRINSTGSIINSTGSIINSTGSIINSTASRLNSTCGRIGSSGSKIDSTGTKMNSTDITNKPLSIVEGLEAQYDYVTNTGTLFCFRTNRNAPNYKVVTVNIDNCKDWNTLVREDARDVLQQCVPINNKQMVLLYLNDVKSALSLHDLQSGEKLIDFKLEIGTVLSITGKRHHTELFFNFTSYVVPNCVYLIDFSSSEVKAEIYKKPRLEKLREEEFDTHQVFYKSKDGTKVPMFILHRKDFVRDASRPCLLYGYGGFHLNLTCQFSVSPILFVNNFRGVFAVANIRGGGEYGEQWRKGGILGKKQNSFDDFQYAARYLLEKRYTSPDKLTIQGGSNGGLLVASCINQAPALFGCAICHVGVLDMLRFHKFTMGHTWVSEYGSSEEPEQFKFLYKYSPLHNVDVQDSVQYPATLLLTADRDRRVVPLHSLKYIAELQNKIGSLCQQTNPLLIRVENLGDHGSGTPTSKIIDEVVDIYCFIGKALGLVYKKK